jgi:hypothetical protein
MLPSPCIYGEAAILLLPADFRGQALSPVFEEVAGELIQFGFGVV